MINDAIRSRVCKKGAIAIFLAGVFVFYLWTASTTYNKPFRFKFSKNLGQITSGHVCEYTANYYNALCDAFLSGKTYLSVKPSKELLALTNPYDPNLNWPYRMHDMSLYRGKYYLYFGPAPALSLFIPFRLVFGRYISQELAVVVFGFGGLLFSILLLNYLTRIYFPGASFGIFFISVAGLSFCNVIPFILRRPLFYEVAISAGYFFLSGSLYWLFSGAWGQGSKLWRLCLGSLFLGLSVGSRPSLIFAFPVLFLIWWRIINKQQNHSMARSIKELSVLSFPFLFCLLAIAIYNYARFGSCLEFGIKYILTILGLPEKIYNFVFFTPSIYFYLFHPCIVNNSFPFFHLTDTCTFLLPADHNWIERTAGAFANFLFLNIIFILPFFYKRMLRFNKYFTLLISFLMFFALAEISFLSIMAGATTMRYMVDFIPYLDLTAILLWFFLDASLEQRKTIRILLGIVMTAAIIYSCLFNIAISFTGYFDLLRYNNPVIYESLSNFFIFL